MTLFTTTMYPKIVGQRKSYLATEFLQLKKGQKYSLDDMHLLPILWRFDMTSRDALSPHLASKLSHKKASKTPAAPLKRYIEEAVAEHIFSGITN